MHNIALQFYDIIPGWFRKSVGMISVARQTVAAPLFRAISAFVNYTVSEDEVLYNG